MSVRYAPYVGLSMVGLTPLLASYVAVVLALTPMAEPLISHPPWLRLNTSPLRLFPATKKFRSTEGHDGPSHKNEPIDADVRIQLAFSEALHAVDELMDPSFYASPSCDGALSEFFRDCVEFVDAAPSSIQGAGGGLFARREIPAGTAFSMYPVHVMGVNFPNDDMTLSVALDDNDRLYFSSLEDGDGTAPSYLVYLLGNRPGEWECDLGEGTAPFIDANPHRPVVPGWCAHLINDGARMRANTEGAALEYFRESDEAQNCLLCPLGPSPLLAAVSTRDVVEGEELFTSYGMAFWLEVLCRQSGEEWIERTDDILMQERMMAMELFSLIQAVNKAYKEVVDSLMSRFELK